MSPYGSCNRLPLFSVWPRIVVMCRVTVVGCCRFGRRWPLFVFHMITGIALFVNVFIPSETGQLDRLIDWLIDWTLRVFTTVILPTTKIPVQYIYFLLVEPSRVMYRVYRGKCKAVMVWCHCLSLYPVFFLSNLVVVMWLSMVPWRSLCTFTVHALHLFWIIWQRCKIRPVVVEYVATS